MPRIRLKKLEELDQKTKAVVQKMESEGIVSPANHVGRREVLVGKEN